MLNTATASSRNRPAKAARSWYREPWPWLLMAGPGTVVLAGIVTTWLAITSDDGLVAGDYYKRGIAINKTLAREERARLLGLAGELQLDSDHRRSAVALRSAHGTGSVLKDTLSEGIHGLATRLDHRAHYPGHYCNRRQPVW